MALTLAEFIAQYSGKTVGCGPGGSAGDFPTGECTALACLWTVNLGLGQPCDSCGAPYRCDGVCWQGSGYPGWTWIPNTLPGVPSPGDLVCFRDGCHGIGASGHVDIFVSGDASSFQSFAQNWDGQYCQVVTHTDYACVVGWQHPGVSATPQPPPPISCSPACDSCSACHGTTCVSSCPAGWSCSGGLCSPPGCNCPSGWSCSGGLCSPPPVSPPATPQPLPGHVDAVAVAGALGVAALTALAAWAALRGRQGTVLGGMVSRAQGGAAAPLTPSATVAAGEGFGGGA